MLTTDLCYKDQHEKGYFHMMQTSEIKTSLKGKGFLRWKTLVEPETLKYNLFGTRTGQADVLRSSASGECQSGSLLLELLYLNNKVL